VLKSGGGAELRKGEESSRGEDRAPGRQEGFILRLNSGGPEYGRSSKEGKQGDSFQGKRQITLLLIPGTKNYGTVRT